MTQGELFVGDDPYAPFGEFPEDYPKYSFKPPHPLLARKADVIGGTNVRRKFYVDMNIGECVCDGNPGGMAWGRNTIATSNKDWYARAACSHKLRLMSMIISGLSDENEILATKTAYLKVLGHRYNPFEAISAFHKELRRGDFKHAWFWALVITTKRSIPGTFKYMLNIIYEETRDHDLANYLLDCLGSPRMQTFTSLSRAVSWFCAAKKKWEMPRRFEIFKNEMYGYRALVKDYGKEVAKGGNIIANGNARAKLLLHMQRGAKSGDLTEFQRGLKGLQKLRFIDKDKPNEDDYKKHRYWLYEQLYELGETLHGDHHDMWQVVAIVNRRAEAGFGIGYHELNAIADALTGEPYDSGLLTPEARKRATARPSPGITLFAWPPIPVYANDNHTYGGKRLMSKFPGQLKPGAKQTDLDFRYCGAYFGVCYRMLCHNQFGSVNDIEWHQVDWPKDLHKIVMDLWY